MEIFASLRELKPVAVSRLTPGRVMVFLAGSKGFISLIHQGKNPSETFRIQKNFDENWLNFYVHHI